LKLPVIKRFKLYYVKLLSRFAFNFNSRRYHKGSTFSPNAALPVGFKVYLYHIIRHLCSEQMDRQMRRLCIQIIKMSP
jgi:hypothetical protein